MEYYDIRNRVGRLRAISIIIGGRGIGKTYSALRFLLDEGKPFLYLRNTDKQMGLCASAFGNPFKKVAADQGRDIIIKSAGDYYIVKDNDSEKVIGFGAALSTFENLRGVDLSEVVYVLFDEFIENRKLSFKQGLAFANLYETINRNRELEGRDPLKCILLSNAQRLSNDILAQFNLISVIEDMMRCGSFMKVTKNYFIELAFSDVSEQKSATALYQLAQGTQYADEAIKNKFTNDSFYNVKKQNLREYRPLCMIDDFYIYRHKSNSTYYICWSRADCISYDSKNTFGVFMRQYGLSIRAANTEGRVYYSDYALKVAFIDTVLKV